MTNVHRALTRCACYVGIIGSILASSTALGQQVVLPSGKTFVRNVTGTVDGGSYVQVVTRAEFNSTLYGTRRYTTLPVQVPKSTLRAGAMHALSRGVMHPGFQLAIAAAGFVWSQHDGILKETDSPGSYLDSSQNYRVFAASYASQSSATNAATSCTLNQSASISDAINSISDHTYSIHGSKGGNFCFVTRPGGSGSWRVTRFSPSSAGVPIHDYGEFPTPPEYTPVTESDLSSIDPHIPVDIVQDLWGNNFAIPQWQNAISVIGQPATSVGSSNPGLIPEVADKVGQWGQNMYDSLTGNQPTYPDVPLNPRTPQEEYYERELDREGDGGGNDWDGPIPDFPEPEINWQTEVLDLPAFNSGIGGGSCPASPSFSLLGQSFAIDYQPACNLATSVKPAVIGVAGVIALLIVVRARGGS